MEKLVIAGREFNSRLFLGTGKFNSNEIMEQSILASGTEMVTVAMKRIELENKEDDMLKAYPSSPHSAFAQHFGRAQCRGSGVCRTNGTRSIRNQLAETGNSS